MRRFKFRAWQKTHRYMTNDIMYANGADAEAGRWYLGDWQDGVHLDDDWDIMQSTGFTDGKDNEIFEGDILRCLKPGTFDKHVNLLVVFDSADHPGIIMLMSPQNKCPFALMADEPDVTIIGNIYEHPNLLIPPQIIMGNA